MDLSTISRILLVAKIGRFCSGNNTRRLLHIGTFILELNGCTIYSLSIIDAKLSIKYYKIDRLSIQVVLHHRLTCIIMYCKMLSHRELESMYTCICLQYVVMAVSCHKNFLPVPVRYP